MEGEDVIVRDRLISPTHLDTPLTYRPQQLATGLVPPHRSLRGQRDAQAELELLMQAAKLETPPTIWDLSLHQSKLMVAKPYHSSKHSHQRLKTHLRAALDNVILQHKSFQGDQPRLETQLHEFQNCHHMHRLLEKNTIRDFWEGVVRLSGGVEDIELEYKLFPYFEECEGGIHLGMMTNDIYLLFSSRLAILSVNEEKILLNRDQLLMISDLVSQRFTLDLAGSLAEFLGIDNYLTPAQLEFIYDWGDKFLECHGQTGYSWIYKWEPLCVGVLINQDKRVLSTFLDELLTEMRSEGPEPVKLGLSAIGFLQGLYNRTPHLVSQAYGLYRIWGHPVIDPIQGALALQKTAKLHRHTNTELSMSITGKFIETFCRRYWRRRGHWPEVDLDGLLSHHPIKIAWERNTIPPILPRNSLSHWSLIKFKQTFPIDPKFDILEMLSDKAMSLNREELIESIQKYYNIGRAESRAVIVQWLKSNLSDPAKFLKDIDEHGFPAEERVVGVCPKEREGKIKARMFGLLTLSKRMYVVLTEALIAEHILPYFHEVTMTDDALTLTKKQIRFTQTTQKGNTLGPHNYRYSSLDFVKWNSNMRKGDTEGVFNAMDQLFGFTNCISRTYEMFSESVIYLADSYFLPPVIKGSKQFKECPELWTGHLGGIEGLRQKGWTVWTVCLLLFVSEGLTGQLELMGQGDNQVIKITYPPHLTPEKITKKHQEFLSKLDDVLTRIGPPLKLEETWTSSDTYVYGKFIIHRGVPLSMSMKKISRLFHLSNDLFPTIESSLSSLSANCLAACASDVTPIIPFIIYSLEVLNCVYTNIKSTYLHSPPIQGAILDYGLQHSIPLHNRKASLFRRTESIDPAPQQQKRALDDLKTFRSKLRWRLLLTPRSLGGLPVLLYPNLLIRKFPDPTLLAISSLKKIHQTATSQDLKMAINDILSPRMASSINYELLLENPCALNLSTPSSPAESKRDVVLKFLLSETRSPTTWIRNENFIHFIETVQLDQDDLSLELMELTPCYPRILSEIWEATPLARTRHAVGRLAKPRP